MNKNLKKYMVPAAAAAMVFAIPTGVYAENAAPEKITFCLDWTPNTNHTGLYVAQAKGYYEDAGLDVEIVQPPENGAALMCAAGQAQFAIEAQDTMAASLALDEPLGITAVAAVIQHNTSGILSRAGDGIDKPAGLTGKTYSTWDSPIELAMLENAVYSAISPRGCASILWKDASKEKEAAEKLHITAEDMVNLGVCDHIIPEPAGGAHMNHQVMAGNISDYLIAALKNLTQKSIANLLEARYNKFRKIGDFQEIPAD